MTDHVTVQSAEIVDFDVTASLWLYAGPDETLILDNALASLDEFLASVKRLGRDINRSALIAALHVAGVQRVQLTTPAADHVLTALQAGNAMDINVVVVGTAD